MEYIATRDSQLSKSIIYASHIGKFYAAYENAGGLIIARLSDGWSLYLQPGDDSDSLRDSLPVDPSPAQFDAAVSELQYSMESPSEAGGICSRDGGFWTFPVGKPLAPVFSLMAAARDYVCKLCGTPQKINTNHTGPCGAYCHGCSHSPSRYNIYGYSWETARNRPMVYCGPPVKPDELNPLHHSDSTYTRDADSPCLPLSAGVDQ